MAYGTNAAQGLVIVGRIDGSPWNGAVREYPIASGYATAIGTNDPVISLADGTIGIGVAGSPARGVFLGCKYTDTSGVFQRKPNWVASTTVLTGTVPIALVADDPNLLFDVQETNGSGAAGTALALADRNLNIDFLIGAPNARTGISTTSINNATEAATATLNLKIIGLSPRPGNVVGSFANWLCAWNTHELKSVGTTGL